MNITLNLDFSRIDTSVLSFAITFAVVGVFNKKLISPNISPAFKAFEKKCKIKKIKNKKIVFTCNNFFFIWFTCVFVTILYYDTASRRNLINDIRSVVFFQNDITLLVNSMTFTISYKNFPITLKIK